MILSNKIYYILTPPLSSPLVLWQKLLENVLKRKVRISRKRQLNLNIS